MIFREQDFSQEEFRSVALLIERRSDDNCGRTPDGKFGPKNDCQDGDGGPTAVAEKPKASKQKAAEAKEPLSWTPAKGVPDAFATVQSSPPVSRAADGAIKSETFDRSTISSFAGREYVSPVACGRHLAAMTAATRGRPIDSKKPLSDDEFEFMAASMTQQAQAAMERGHTPAFYSPEERKKQIEQYATLHPVMRGGVTASGFKIGTGEPGESIHPSAEFLFRAVQALTSPQASPFPNMQRADQVLTNFFTNPDVDDAKLHKASVGGNVSSVTKGSLERLQAIIDKVGLEEAARIFSEPPMRAGDLEKFFRDRVGIEGFSAGGYSVDEVVPTFSIFGPKVGPFFANNTGDYDALTADVWFTRTWGRLTGELVSETKPDLAKSHAKDLKTLLKYSSEEDFRGLDRASLEADVANMAKTGDIPESVATWALQRSKRYSKEGFNKGVKGVRDKANARLSIAILKNLASTLDEPETTTRRSSMIKVMQEVSARIGQPVAYVQDLLWQDEQDVWGAAGARTATDIGEPSLFSTGIERLVRDPDSRPAVAEKKKPSRKKGKTSKRSLVGESQEEFDGIGDIEQLLFEDELQDVTAEEFAEAFADFFSDRDEDAESRSADCGREDDGTFADGNSCRVGINVNDKHQDFTGQILAGTKTTETRVTNSLKPYVGKTVGIVRTGKGKATLVGTMKVGEPKFYATAEDFDADFDKHQVAKDSPHYIGPEGKYGYPLTEVKKVKPVTIESQGRVARVISRSLDEETIEYTFGESRSADCGRDEGGRFGSGNDCAKDGSDGNATLKAAVVRWKGNTSDIGLHVQDELDGKPIPSSGSGKKLREMAASLLAEVKTNSDPAPRLYRGDDKPPSANSSPLLGWTSNKKVAEHWARVYGGQVYELEGATGVNLKKIAGETLDGGEDEWIVVNHRSRKSSRSTDCGRTPDGKFGDNNKCQDDAGTATQDDPIRSGGTGEKQWSGGELKSEPPFPGAEKLASFTAAAGEQVADRLDGLAMNVGEAVKIVGADRDGNSVYVRPAVEFAGDGDNAVLIRARRDVAGVKDGIEATSVLMNVGPKDRPEIVLKHHLIDVTDAVKSDATRRHVAAREFFKSMADSVKAARAGGVSKVVLNAAGRAGGSTFKGYTIWPRMGFDAPLPFNLKQKLPEGLSHAKTLLDLHTTREGARWWRDNGTDIDVVLDLANHGSPQNQAFDAFVRKLLKESREMPLGSGDEWLSPEDLIKLDELWDELDEKGLFDEYDSDAADFSILDGGKKDESRSRDCGQDDAGRFNSGNKCASDGDYRGSHKAPKNDGYAVAADDLTGLYPDDVYSSDSARLYGHGDPSLDRESARIVQSLKGKPDETVRIYRAVPADADDVINPGDWVTINESYAKQHGESTLGGDYKVASMLAPARHIFNDGNGIHEWGYDPRPKKEGRAFCPTGDGNGIDNSCGTATATADSSWKKSGREYYYEPGDGKSPIEGGDDIKSLSIERPKDVAAAMKHMKAKSLTDLVAISGGLTRGASTSIFSPAHGEEIHVMSDVPIDPDNDSSGSMSSTISLGVDPDGKRYVNYKTMSASGTDDGAANLTGADAARMSSLLLEKFPESLEAAERAGIHYAKTFAFGDSENEFKGYRLWPKFGFDGEIYDELRLAIPKDIVPHDKPLTIQELISTPAGDRWWSENGESMAMTLNLKDKKSDGYKRYRSMASLAKRLKRRNEGRSLYDVLTSDTRAFCPTGEGGGIDNSCGSDGQKMAADKDSGGPSSKWGGETEAWGSSSGTEIWTPGRPLFAGAEKIASIKIERPNQVRDILGDSLKISIADAVLASGAIVESPSRASITQPRLEVVPDPMTGEVTMHWTCQGAATGRGFKGDEAQYADKPGTVVKAFEASRDLRRTPSGTVLRMAGLFIHPDFQGKGLAIESVARSVSSPVTRIEMDADRFDDPNPQMRLTGYSVWPKYGYDAPISTVLRVAGRALPDSLSRAKTLLHLYSLPGGREWWTENGRSIPLVFDMRPRSNSREVLLQLQDRTRRRSIDVSKPIEQLGADSDYDEALDEVWADIQKKGLSGQAPSEKDWNQWEQERTDGGSGKVQPH